MGRPKGWRSTVPHGQNTHTHHYGATHLTDDSKFEYEKCTRPGCDAKQYRPHDCAASGCQLNH